MIRRAPSGSRVVLHPAPEQLTVDVVGELDGRTTRDLAAILLPAVGRGSRTVHLDLSQASYIGIGGADALAAAGADADRLGGRVVVTRVSRPARRALEEAGLGSMLPPDPHRNVVDLTSLAVEAPAPVADLPIAQTG